MQYMTPDQLSLCSKAVLPPPHQHPQLLMHFLLHHIKAGHGAFHSSWRGSLTYDPIGAGYKSRFFYCTTLAYGETVGFPGLVKFDMSKPEGQQVVGEINHEGSHRQGGECQFVPAEQGTIFSKGTLCRQPPPPPPPHPTHTHTHTHSLTLPQHQGCHQRNQMSYIVNFKASAVMTIASMILVMTILPER